MTTHNRYKQNKTNLKIASMKNVSWWLLLKKVIAHFLQNWSWVASLTLVLIQITYHIIKLKTDTRTIKHMRANNKF